MVSLTVTLFSISHSLYAKDEESHAYRKPFQSPVAFAISSPTLQSFSVYVYELATRVLLLLRREAERTDLGGEGG
jgi:hypothetical protein